MEMLIASVSDDALISLIVYISAIMLFVLGFYFIMRRQILKLNAENLEGAEKKDL